MFESAVSKWPLGPQSQNSTFVVGPGLQSFVLQNKQTQSILDSVSDTKR